MKLQLIGHDYKYVAEQSLLALFPQERPVYGEVDPASDSRWAVITIREDGDQCTVTTELGWDGKSAPFVHTDIREAQCTLPKDGTQCTLLGLLALGDDNCCGEEPEEKPQTDTTSESPEQKTLFDDDEDLKRQIEEAKYQAEIRRKQEEEDRKRKKKKHDKDNHQSQGGNSNWFTSILNKGKSIFDDDEDTKMN